MCVFGEFSFVPDILIIVLYYSSILFLRILQVSPKLATKDYSLTEEQLESLLSRADLDEVGTVEAQPFDILVCGWREEWSFGFNLVNRTRQLSERLPNGSRLQFLNRMDPLKFTALMDNGGFERADGHWVLRGTGIYHTQGDAADLDTLREVMRVCEYESAIVMGTMAGVKLSPQSRDRRVLSTMLMVRKAHYDLYESPLHIVGENALDATAVLAATTVSPPDFVNTQAIYARALTQALAYPFMQPAVAQLFHQTAGNPEIYLSPVGTELVPFGSWQFKELVYIVQDNCSTDICIGVLKADKSSTLAWVWKCLVVG